MLSVTDTGSGMTEDMLARAFQPFFTTKEIGQGTGLGLSQVYGFVKQSGGHIKLYSEIDHGTTVKMYFPRFPRGETLDDSEAELHEPRESRETILLVEDDDVRAYLIEVLRSLGYRVTASSNGENALALLSQSEPPIDLILTDVVMPGMSGRELGMRALELRPELKVIYMTGYSRNAVVHQGRLDPGIELLQKPITETDLATRIRDALDQRN
jgi:CheY-like chemotaxis protein